MCNRLSFLVMQLPRIIPWRMCFIVLAWISCLTPVKAHAQWIETPSWRQAQPALSTVVASADQEDRWREREIHRYAPGGQSTMMGEKSGDYVKLVVAPLLLFIVALAVVRLFDS